MRRLTFTIPGPPVVLKNSKRVVTVKGKVKVIESEAAAKYRKRAVPRLALAWRRRCGRWEQPIKGPVSLMVTAYMNCHSDSGNAPDMSNLLQMPEDLLQHAGVIEDDRQIEHHDGSRRVFLCDGPCPMKGVYKSGPKKGEERQNCGAVKRCPYARLELELREASLECPVDDDYVEGL